MSVYPTIDQYLLSTCLLLIDELNERYKHISKIQLKQIADEKYNEMDICVKIGEAFRPMSHYTVGDKNKKSKGKVNHDIFIESKDFKIEVKYLKNWKSSSGTNSASKKWNEFKEDFDWLLHELKEGNKGKRAFIMGWFNCVSHFSQLIQLGESVKGKSVGKRPLASERKIYYFPFLRKINVPTYTTDLVYNYTNAYKILPVNLIGTDGEDYSCIFLGNETDVFHFAIYF